MREISSRWPCRLQVRGYSAALLVSSSGAPRKSTQKVMVNACESISYSTIFEYAFQSIAGTVPRDCRCDNSRNRK